MKPILFNTEMVKAILEGRKTATRRLGSWKIKKFDIDRNGLVTATVCKGSEKGLTVRHFAGGTVKQFIEVLSDYKVNDVLYVRETWCDDRQYTKDDTAGIYFYKANEKNSYNVKWRPSIHMPKEAARLFLRVTDVRVERLQDMKLADFIAEGIRLSMDELRDQDKALHTARELFRDLWNSTCGKKDTPERYANNWYGNPFVWVIEFEVIDKPVEEG